MSEDRCIICGEIIPEGRQVCPNCEKDLVSLKLIYPLETEGKKPMKNLSHGEMVQIAEEKKNKPPRYIDANKLIDLATHEGAYGYVDVHDIYNAPTADVVERKKGFWEWVDDMDYRCSVCHKYAYGCLGEVLSGHYKYCPYCGSAMEGEEDDAH